jgi:serine/threonine protein kinase
LIGKILGGRYEIKEKLGSGGMAVVYKARCTWLDRIVTVKVLRDELVNDEEFVRRFRQEAQAVARLSHPNIVSVYDVGQEDGTYYIVMEYIDGQTLKEMIKEKGKLSPEKAIDLTSQICSALEHAHENNIIHRDIKPHNILMTSRGKVKVADFGIARAAAETTVTHPGKIMGSVHYLSPEQARGEVVGISSDLYSAGAVLYEMLTGRVPFEGESPISVALKHLQDPIIPPRELDPTIPEPVEQVILRALNKDPKKRFSSAREMLKALKAAGRGETIDFLLEPYDEGTAEGRQPLPDNNNPTWQDETRSFERPAGQVNKTKKKPRPITWVLLSLLILGLFIGLVYAGSKLVMVPDVTVPNVQGKLAEEAIRELRIAGLEGVVVSKPFNNEIEKDRVISQKPLPNELAKKGRQVELIVSQGAQLDVVPNVKGRNATEAGILLSNRGFKSEVEEVYDSLTAKGLVISQTPAADSQQPIGTTVHLYVSLGPEPQDIYMPDLVGKKLEEAQAKLTQMGLTLGSVTEEASNQYFVGQVVNQDPAVNKPVPPGGVVNLKVSKGPGPFPLSEEIELDVPKTGTKHEVVIVVEDLKGTREEYSRLHEPGDRVKTMVRYYGQARIRVLLDGKQVEEKNL